MTLTIALAALLAYTVTGYLAAVPHMIRRSVETKIDDWLHDPRLTIDGLTIHYQRSDRHPEDAPIAQFRRQAARWWPLMCLLWGPWLAAIAATRAWDRAVDATAGRARPTSTEQAIQAREQQRRTAAQAARITELEHELGLARTTRPDPKTRRRTDG